MGGVMSTTAGRTNQPSINNKPLSQKVDDLEYYSYFAENRHDADVFEFSIQHTVKNPRQRQTIYQPVEMLSQFKMRFRCVEGEYVLDIKASYAPAFVNFSPLIDFFRPYSKNVDETFFSSCIKSKELSTTTIKGIPLTPELMSLLEQHANSLSSQHFSEEKFFPKDQLDELSSFLLTHLPEGCVLMN